MANTEYIFLSGKAKWIRVNEPNKYGKWSLDLYMDQENLEKIRELKKKGLMNKIKMDDDGEFVTLSRPTSVQWIKGDTKQLLPPIVLDKNGTPAGRVAIGNGSDLTCKMEVYGFGPKEARKIAMRLVAIRIDNLIKFEGKDFTPEESKKVEGFAQQPEPMF